MTAARLGTREALLTHPHAPLIVVMLAPPLPKPSQGRVQMTCVLITDRGQAAAGSHVGAEASFE